MQNKGEGRGEYSSVFAFACTNRDLLVRGGVMHIAEDCSNPVISK